MVRFLELFFQLSLIKEAYLTISTGRENTTNPSVYETENFIDKVKNPNGYITETRPLLPRGNLFDVRQNITSLKCGEGYAIVTEGFKYFKLDYTPEDRNTLCYHAFFGSWTYNCTVAVLCNETVEFANPNESRFVISDGTEGFLNTSGSYSFDRKPRYASNGGHDLYMFYRGASSSSCLAFCKEDLTSEHVGVESPVPLEKDKALAELKTMDGSCTCGLRKEPGRYSRVVNGDNALKFEFPWIAAMVSKDETKNRQPFCGASLISDQYLLSATHCFMVKYNQKEHKLMNPKDIQVLLHAHVMNKPNSPKKGWTNALIPGWNLPQTTDQEEKSVRVDIESFISHPLFHPKSLDWDVTIIKLKDKINFTASDVSPVCLPPLTEKVHFKDNDFHTVAGWGKTQNDGTYGSRVLQKLDYPFVNISHCNKYALPTKRHICGAYFQAGTAKSPCEGDSGGPMIYKFKPETNQYMLSGIMSGKDGRCGRKDFMNLFTNVQEVLQWVYRHTINSTWCA